MLKVILKPYLKPLLYETSYLFTVFFMSLSVIKKPALPESVSTWFSWSAVLKQCDFTSAFQKNKFTKGLY